MNDNEQHPNECGEFERLAMRITAEVWGPLQFNPDFRAPESARYVEELTLAHNADCVAYKARIAELEVQLINQSDWYVEWKKWEQTANELKTVLNEVVDYYSKQGTGKVYNLGYSGDTQKEMKLKKAIGK